MTTLLVALSFAVLAAAGAAVRALAAAQLNDAGRPLGTLLVNLAGSLLAGLAMTMQEPFATLLVAAAAGALTTFSTFAAEVTAMHRDASRFAALLYLLGTVGACSAVAWLGLSLR